MRRLIQPRSATRSTATRCTSGGCCCAEMRSNTRSLVTSHWTARSLMGTSLTTYPQRCGRSVKTIKATTLTDTESLAVLHVHCCIEREHDTKASPQAVAADNGFQCWHTEYEIAAHNIESLVRYCGSTVEAGSGASAQTKLLHRGTRRE